MIKAGLVASDGNGDFGEKVEDVCMIFNGVKGRSNGTTTVTQGELVIEEGVEWAKEMHLLDMSPTQLQQLL